MKKLNNVTAAYIAGVLDGRGRIRFNFGPISKVRVESGETFIRVSSSYRQILDFLQDKLGEGAIIPSKPKNPKHKMIWIWKLSPRPTFKLLRRITPYLQIKRGLANVILKNEALITKKGPRSEAEAKRCRRLSEQIRLLSE